VDYFGDRLVPCNPALHSHGKIYGRTTGPVVLQNLNVGERRGGSLLLAERIRRSVWFNPKRSVSESLFGEQAVWWIEHIQTRKRRPAKHQTAYNYKHLLDRWILPCFADVPLGDVNNSTVKPLVLTMEEKRMAAESIHHVVKVVKLVVASYVDEDGESVFKRNWNHEFMDIPVIDRRSQRRPTFTGEEVSRISSVSEGRYKVLFALLAGSGSRIAEALGLEVGKHVSADCSTLTVGQSVWRHGETQAPKTVNGFREIDLGPSLAQMLCDFVGDRRGGFLFATDSGRPLGQRNALRALHSVLKLLGIEKRGFHAFRRFRQTHLRKNRAPEDLIRFWLGWACKSVPDHYCRLSEDVVFGKKIAESMGLGFEVPSRKSDNIPNGTLR
jgi:integrase